jgi:hypothetical protein
MKRKIIVFLATILIIVLTGCATTDFKQATSTSDIEASLSKAGLNICEQASVPTVEGLGLVKGQFYQLNTDCAQFDANRPGAKVWALEFDSLAARNAGLRRLTSEWRRGLGHAYVWTAGPYLILVDGPRLSHVEANLKQAMLALGAR